MFLSDKDIIKRNKEESIITPFIDHKVSQGMVLGKMTKIPSYGLSQAGYDVTLQPVYKISNEYLPDLYKSCMSILDDSKDWYMEVSGDYVDIPAKGFMLGVTNEYIKMPNDLSGLLIAKSTLIRMGLFFSPTNIEPGWEGEVVVEIFNANPFGIRLYPNVGIGQIQFAQLSSPVETPYRGKYQGQKGIQAGYYGPSLDDIPEL